ncbi:MAG: glycosyltransferase family 4 protein [Microthrixaceae bacterium]
MSPARIRRSTPEARKRLGIPEAPTVGFVSRLTPEKGLDTMVEAMERVWRTLPDTRVLVAGNPTRWTGSSELLDRLTGSEPDRVSVIPGFADDLKADVYSACDVIAFPTRGESFGMIITEAWCARRPLVVSRLPAVESIVREGTDAIAVAVGDPDALADGVIALLADRSRRRSWLGPVGPGPSVSSTGRWSSMPGNENSSD